MTLHEKKQEMEDLLRQIAESGSIEELLKLTGMFFYELFISFDTEQIKNLSGEIDMVVQSLLIPAAQNIGKEKTPAIKKDIDSTIQDILTLLDSSSIYE